VSVNSIEAYEKYALQFLRCRDHSRVGVRAVERWARSLKPKAIVLELGCGGGIPVTRTLVEAGLNLWAIDSSPTLVATFRDRFPDIPVRCASVLQSDFFQRTYEAVISIGLVFLLDEEGQLKMLSRVAKILRPGGSFLFTAPVEAGEWADAVTGHKCMSLGEAVYLKELRNSGFEDAGCYNDSGENNYYEVKKVMRP
jgi:cyclopropane fatty-acyl-phospholipid synthase-like methyltransferase